MDTVFGICLLVGAVLSFLGPMLTIVGSRESRKLSQLQPVKVILLLEDYNDPESLDYEEEDDPWIGRLLDDPDTRVQVFFSKLGGAPEFGKPITALLDRVTETCQPDERRFWSGRVRLGWVMTVIAVADWLVVVYVAPFRNPT